MGDYIHGWRRKAACVTLTMAIASIVATAASYGIGDSVWKRQWPGILFSERDICWLFFTDDPYGNPEFKRDRPEPYLLRIMHSWPIIFALFLLSGRLLLSEPRVAKPKKTIEPVPAERA